jgi:hypothetical protein
MDVIRNEPRELSQKLVGQWHIINVVKYLCRSVWIGLEKVFYNYSG